ncbi:PRA1 family protein F2 [Trifolium repens]|nr:PRA1 family protein F2 [Trifolium repens]
MQNNHRSTNENRNQDIEPYAGEDKSDDGECGEYRENEAVVDGVGEEDNGAVTEEEKEEPGGEDGEEDDEGERVPEKAEEED